MSRRRVVLLAGTSAVLLVLVGAFAVWRSVVSARRSPEVIRAGLLAITPPGTSLADVEASIRVHNRDKGMGWRVDSHGVKRDVVIQYDSYRTFGTLLFPTTLEAHYHFDQDGTLRDVTVHRFPEPFPGQKD